MNFQIIGAKDTGSGKTPGLTATQQATVHLDWMQIRFLMFFGKL